MAQHVGGQVVAIHRNHANTGWDRIVADPAMDGDTDDRGDCRPPNDSRQLAELRHFASDD